MSTLVKLNNELEEILKVIQENDGEIPKELELILEKNLQETKEKVSSYCLMLDKLENEISFVKRKISEANSYVYQVQKNKERLEEIALRVIEKKGSKLEGENGRWINIRKSKQLEIVDEELVPYIYFKMQSSIDKAAIKKEMLDKNIEIDGCKIIENLNINWK